MVENIEKLCQLDFAAVIIGVCVIATTVKAIYEFILSVIHTFGIETRSTKQKREEHELLIKTVQNVDALQVKQDKDNQLAIKHDREIKTDLEELKTMFVEKQIEDIRWELLDFCSALTGGRKYNREAFDHIFRTYQNYEEILEKHNMENGLVSESMKVCEEIYHERLKNGEIK